MDADRAHSINEHLAEAFDHLREAIMLTVAGEPPIGGAASRLERFAATGDTEVLLEGLDDLSLRPRPGETPEDVAVRVTAAAVGPTGLFDEDVFSKKVEGEPREYEDIPEMGESDVPVDEPNMEQEFTEEEVEEIAAEAEEEEEDEFDSFFDDLDEDVQDEPGDAPAAF